MEGVALEVAALKGSEVGQEERREGSPGKGGLGRSCLGFGNLGGGTHRQTHRQERQAEKVESCDHPNAHFNSS